MEKNFETPYFDKAVGLGSERANQQKEFEEYLTERIKINGGKFIEGLELEKSEREKEIINFVLNAADEYLEEYGREKDVKKPLDNVHILKEGGVKEFTEVFEDGAHSVSLGSVMVDRVKSDVEFSLRLFHEIFHSLSYQALQELTNKNGERKIEAYRSGFAVFSRDGEEKYFVDLEEAVVGKMTKRFLEEKVLKSDLFDDDQKESEVFISRGEEMEKMDDLINDLWEKNKTEFKERKEIEDLFFDAQINGNLLKVGKLIERTYGAGSFRKLGEGKF